MILSHSGSIIGERQTVSRNADRRSRQYATCPGSVEPHSSGPGPARAPAGSRSSSSAPMPAMTGVPSQSVIRSIQITSPPAERPPRSPYRSTRVTRWPSRRAATAAAVPAGPPPTTSTSVSSCTGISRAGSVTVATDGTAGAGEWGLPGSPPAVNSPLPPLIPAPK